MTKFLELISKFKYKHVFNLTYSIPWSDGRTEYITFILLENGFGRRTYKIHCEGYVKLYRIWKTYVPIGEAWKAGASLKTVEAMFEHFNH